VLATDDASALGKLFRNRRNRLSLIGFCNHPIANPRHARVVQNEVDSACETGGRAYVARPVCSRRR
jgi:hypothetical protein